MTYPEAGPLGKAAVEQLNQGELPRLPSSSEITCSIRRAKLAPLSRGNTCRRRAAALLGLILGFLSRAWLYGVDVNHLLQLWAAVQAPVFLNLALPCAERVPGSCEQVVLLRCELQAPGPTAAFGTTSF